MCRTGGSDGSIDKLALEYSTIDLGMVYQHTQNIRIGIMLKNIFGFPYQAKYNSFKLPKDVTFALSIKDDRFTWSLDNEFTIGNFGGFGDRTTEIWLLRAGMEYEIDEYWRLRGGLIYPVMAKSSTLGDMKKNMPFPQLGGTAGVGLVLEHFNIDMAVFGDPAYSYIEQKPVIGVTGTLTLKF